jgi:hypothetical protein
MNYNVPFLFFFNQAYTRGKPSRIERKVFVSIFPEICKKIRFGFLRNWLPNFLFQVIFRGKTRQQHVNTKGPHCNNIWMTSVSGKFSRKYLFWGNFCARQVQKYAIDEKF